MRGEGGLDGRGWVGLVSEFDAPSWPKAQARASTRRPMGRLTAQAGLDFRRPGYRLASVRVPLNPIPQPAQRGMEN